MLTPNETLDRLKESITANIALYFFFVYRNTGRDEEISERLSESFAFEIKAIIESKTSEIISK